MIDQGLQEGPAAAGEPAQVWEMRGHVQSDLPQRCFGPPQFEATLLRPAHLRKTLRSQWGDARTLLPPSPRTRRRLCLALSGLECPSFICEPSRFSKCFEGPVRRSKRQNASCDVPKGPPTFHSVRHPRLVARQDARILRRSVVVKQDNMSRRLLVSPFFLSILLPLGWESFVRSIFSSS